MMSRRNLVQRAYWLSKCFKFFTAKALLGLGDFCNPNVDRKSLWLTLTGIKMVQIACFSSNLCILQGTVHVQCRNTRIEKRKITLTENIYFHQSITGRLSIHVLYSSRCLNVQCKRKWFLLTPVDMTIVQCTLCSSKMMCTCLIVK